MTYSFILNLPLESKPTLAFACCWVDHPSKQTRLLADAFLLNNRPMYFGSMSDVHWPFMNTKKLTWWQIGVTFKGAHCSLIFLMKISVQIWFQYMKKNWKTYFSEPFRETIIRSFLFTDWRLHPETCNTKAFLSSFILSTKFSKLSKKVSFQNLETKLYFAHC